jgi:hypothetical protein
MPRFVILEHDYPERHWDFMLEMGEVLRTWKLSMPPRVGQPINAELSFDHRLHYLDYEGPISGNRGSVVRWDGGSFAWQEEGDTHLRVDLQGTRYAGAVELVRQSDHKWHLTLVGYKGRIACARGLLRADTIRPYDVP